MRTNTARCSLGLPLILLLAGCAPATPTSRSPGATEPPSARTSTIAPSRSTPVPTLNDPFVALTSRPLTPLDPVGEGCEPSPTREVEPRVAVASGSGPVVAVFGPRDGRIAITGTERNAFGRYFLKTLWISMQPDDDLILVRIARIDGDGDVPGFDRGHAPNADGMPTQLRLGPKSSIRFGGGPMPDGWRAWTSGTLVPAIGCYDFQVDTARDTDHIVFEVIE